MIATVNSSHLIFEKEDNYQKQTYRNRSYIAHSNGKLLLNIPIKHSVSGERQKTKDVNMDSSFPWQSQHWKSLQSAYRTSPFFEYYEEEIKPIFFDPVSSLFELNMRSFDLVCELLELEVEYSFTTSYEIEPNCKDLRHLINAKSNKIYLLDKYTQVLGSSHGFIPNLSILDLLFNEGTNALGYLESQKLDF